MCLILAQLRLSGQKYIDYYKGDTLIKADRNTYTIRYSKLGEGLSAYIYIDNVNNRNTNVKGLMYVFNLQDRKVFSDVIRDNFTQDELKAMYKDYRAILKTYPYIDYRVAFTFGVSVNKYTERIETFMVDFCDTPCRRNISLKKIERMENQLRERVKFKLFEGRRQFLQDAEVFRHDFIRIYFHEVIDNFGSL